MVQNYYKLLTSIFVNVPEQFNCCKLVEHYFNPCLMIYNLEGKVVLFVIHQDIIRYQGSRKKVKRIFDNNSRTLHISLCYSWFAHLAKLLLFNRNKLLHIHTSLN